MKPDRTQHPQKTSLRSAGTHLPALLLLGGAGTAAAADTTQITPSVILTFETVPDGLLTGSELGIDAAAEITADLKTLLKNMKGAKIDNAAYAVALTPKGFGKSDIIKTTIRLPAASAWNSAHKNVYAAAITGNTGELLPVTLIGTNGDKHIVFEAATRGLPDMVLLVSTTEKADFSITATAWPTPRNISRGHDRNADRCGVGCGNARTGTSPPRRTPHRTPRSRTHHHIAQEEKIPSGHTDRNHLLSPP